MRPFLFLAVGMVVILAIPLVGWAAPDYSNVKESYDAFDKFVEAVKGYLALITATGSAGATISSMLFLAISVYVLSMAVAKWMMKQADLFDVGVAVFLIIIVKTIQSFYGTLTELLHTFSTDLAGAIQQPIVGTTDVLFAPAYIHNIMSNLSFVPADIFAGLNAVVAVVVVYVTASLLSVVSFFTVAWGTWGYAVAKLIGWFFIPFLMVPRLSFLFDGWFRFMVGFLVYDVLARLNIALSLVLLTKYFGLPLSAGSVSAPIVMPGLTFAEFSGFIVLAIVALVGLLATGKFSVSIASGVGGVGSGLARITLGAGAAARALAL
jgi:hypothetical protein